MRAARLVVDFLIAHCGGSYAAALVAVPAAMWYGLRGAGVLVAAAIAPVSGPAMIWESVVGNFGRQFFLICLAITLPAYLIGFAVTLRLQLARRFRRGWCERTTAGLCGACGYNLTGNASGVCPECGRAVASSGLFTTKARWARRREEEASGYKQ
jgi:hypothetical protein